MSDAVNTLTRLNTPFAIRGGGHMPIANAANINSSGVLLSSSGLSHLQLSMDHQTVSVGPGNRWSDVYQYLEPFGLTVVGGRMGVVGVPGFLLGGGISFFSNQYGWASANVVSYTVSTTHVYTLWHSALIQQSVYLRMGASSKLPLRTSTPISSGP